MTESRSKTSSALMLALSVGLVAAASLLFAGPASAQSVDCPAGARGGNAGDAGRSTGGSGGLAFTVPGFGTGTQNVDASGGTGGSARGGTGGRGGSGTLPICNQNTNGDRVVAAAPAAKAAAPAHAAPAARAVAAPSYGAGGGAPARSYGTGGGGGLARTGASTSVELGLAGLAFLAGGVLLFFGQPLRRVGLRA